MIEVIIERWSQRDGRTDFLWSIWHDGKRAAMGEPHGNPEAAEAEARAVCRRALGQAPDKVTHL